MNAERSWGAAAPGSPTSDADQSTDGHHGTARFPLEVTIPQDVAAEWIVAAIAVESKIGGLQQVANGVDEAWFYDPAIRRVYLAALACELDGIDQRVDAIAEVCGQYRSFVDDLTLVPRIATVDSFAHYARRLADAHGRRCRLFELLHELEQVAA